MTDTTSTTQTAPATTEPTKAQKLAAERAEKRAAKEAAKAQKKAENAAKRADGVIGTIKAQLSRPEGTTKAETLAALQAKFPDRDAMGMSCTIGIQFSRLSKTTPVINRKLGDRGRVYGFATTVKFPEEVAEGPAEKPVTKTMAPSTAPIDAMLPDKSATAPSGRDALAVLKGGKGNKKGGKK